MLFKEYHILYLKYLDAQEMVNDILDEKMLIFQKTQPKSTTGEYERENDKTFKIMSSGGSMVNPLESYVIEMEQRHVNERLAEAKEIMMDRLDMLRRKEKELRASKDRLDVVYVLKHFGSMNAKDISDMINYSEAQVFRFLKKIEKSLNMIENERK